MVELTVVVAIAAVLLAVGLPALGTYLQNSKLRNTAKTLFSSVQLARAEAIRRNLAVDFILTSTAVSSTMADSPVATTSGPNWVVRAVVPDAVSTNPPTYEPVEMKSWQDGSGQSVGATSAVAINSTASSVRFNGVGGVSNVGTGGPATVTLDVTNSVGGTCAADGGPMRCQRIIITPGGQLRLCDPAVASTATHDPRVCPS